VEAEATSVRASTYSVHVRTRMVGEGCICEIVGVSSRGAAAILAVRPSGVRVDAACSLDIRLQSGEVLCSEGPLVAVHQLLRRNLGDELLLLGDEVHLRGLLVASHKALITSTERESALAHTKAATVLWRSSGLREGIEIQIMGLEVLLVGVHVVALRLSLLVTTRLA